jgi:hypothetical protein
MCLIFSTLRIATNITSFFFFFFFFFCLLLTFHFSSFHQIDWFPLYFPYLFFPSFFQQVSFYINTLVTLFLP